MCGRLKDPAHLFRIHAIADHSNNVEVVGVGFFPIQDIRWVKNPYVPVEHSGSEHLPYSIRLIGRHHQRARSFVGVRHNLACCFTSTGRMYLNAALSPPLKYGFGLHRTYLQTGSNVLAVRV